MNEYSQPGAGKIEIHGNGLGVASPEQVEQRAREIALIAERDPEAFTDADWEQARQELIGAGVSAAPEETIESDDSGHRVPRTEDEDESVGEQLVAGGVEEATHDQMLEARRQEIEQEGLTS